MKFKDFEIGMVVTHPPVVVTREEMLAFARSYDSQYFHVDEEAARESPGALSSG